MFHDVCKGGQGPEASGTVRNTVMAACMKSDCCKKSASSNTLLAGKQASATSGREVFSGG